MLFRYRLVIVGVIVQVRCPKLFLGSGLTQLLPQKELNNRFYLFMACDWTSRATLKARIAYPKQALANRDHLFKTDSESL